MARAAKLDTLLAQATSEAREALTPVAPQEQVGQHLGVSADAERLVTHRFEALVPGYRGWEWYVSLARPSRGKIATVCESGIIPGPDALLAPPWVPWSDRMEPEEIAAAKEASENAHGVNPDAEAPAESAASAREAAAPEGADAEGEDELGPDAAASSTEGDADDERDADERDDEDDENEDEARSVRGQRRRRRRRR